MAFALIGTNKILKSGFSEYYLFRFKSIFFKKFHLLKSFQYFVKAFVYSDYPQPIATLLQKGSHHIGNLFRFHFCGLNSDFLETIAVIIQKGSYRIGNLFYFPFHSHNSGFLETLAALIQKGSHRIGNLFWLHLSGYYADFE